jgi:putative FmdB family regulatory protein
MPLYEYVCRGCSHEFEELVFGDESVTCPECGSSGLVDRLLSVPARPRSEGASLPMSCSSDGPSCGAPWCQRK